MVQWWRGDDGLRGPEEALGRATATHLQVRMPPEHLPGEVFQACPMGGVHRVDPEPAGEIRFPMWFGKAFLEETLEVTGEKTVWASLLKPRLGPRLADEDEMINK